MKGQLKKGLTQKRWLSGLLGLVTLISIGIGGLSLSVYRQLTQIPEHLQLIPLNLSTGERHDVLQKRALATVEALSLSPSVSDGAVNAQLSSQQLNAFFAYRLAWQLEGQGSRQILKGTHVEITQKTIKTLTLLDLSQISGTDLQGGDRLSLLLRLLKIPGLSDRTVAVTVEGSPIVEDRSLGLQNPVVSLGNVRLAHPNLTRWLGVSEAILQDSLNKEWNNLPITLSSVQIRPDSKGVPHLQLEGQLTAW